MTGADTAAGSAGPGARTLDFTQELAIEVGNRGDAGKQRGVLLRRDEPPVPAARCA
jgi:hypothetical protein